MGSLWNGGSIKNIYYELTKYSTKKYKYLYRPFQIFTILQKQFLEYGKIINDENGVFKFFAEAVFRKGVVKAVLMAI